MRVVLLFLVVITALGCTRVSVRKNPGPEDQGIRYYRPKPYLMITPSATVEAKKPTLTATTTIEQGLPLDVRLKGAANEIGRIHRANFEPLGLDAQTGGEALPTPPAVPNTASDKKAVPCPPILIVDDKTPTVKANISLLYLPDFSEEYSIQLRPGLGIGELNIQLENGWNLTTVGIKTDQQTDEIITSVANLVGSVGQAAAPGYADGAPTVAQVLATNIPFGMYEAIIAQDPYGRKQLYGWRYVGFMPFQACPVIPQGLQCASCDDPTAVYGIVMDSSGTLRFERLGEIPYLAKMACTPSPK